MHIYWITPGKPPYPRLVVGVTARSEEDALALYEMASGLSDESKSVVHITNMQELDQDHVIPNMGNALKRSIWFPLGFDHLSV